MTSKRKPYKQKPDDPEQSRRFEEAAQAIELDEMQSAKAFKKAVKVVVRASKGRS